MNFIWSKVKQDNKKLKNQLRLFEDFLYRRTASFWKTGSYKKIE